ncbi:MAG TPA: hypothetical protein DCW68_01740 [Rhodospirillaceae bacterium]|nr:MAG: hypothetical protein A2018_04705 [Alphaproteobacteria bacterium GWF2_58_20]HAU28818.1 hypothetical protein [Rhodospirillaceae bacterium]
MTSRFSLILLVVLFPSLARAAPMVRRPIPVCDNVTGCMDENPADIRILSLSPVNGASGVSPHTALVMKFSKDMKAGTGNIRLRYASDGSEADILLASSVIISGDEAILPFSALDEGESYYVEIPPGALQSDDGYPYPGFSGSTTWAFSTLDSTAPTLVSLDPVSGATGVPVVSELRLEMSERVLPGTGNIIIRKVLGGDVFDSLAVTDPSIVLFVDDVVVLDYTGELEENTEYEVIVPSGSLMDGAGHSFAGIDAGTWRFQTFSNYNPPPEVGDALENVVVAVGTSLSYAIPAGAFIDTESYVLSASLADGSALPAWMGFDGAAFSGTPAVSDAGTSSIRVTATDGKGQTVSQTFDVFVNNLPVPMAWSMSPTDVDVESGTARNIIFMINEPDAGQTVSVVPSFSTDDGISTVNWTNVMVVANHPLAISMGATHFVFVTVAVGNYVETGSTILSFVANDGFMDSDPFPVNVQVFPFNPPPVVSSGGNPVSATIKTGQDYTFYFEAADASEPVQALTAVASASAYSFLPVLDQTSWSSADNNISGSFTVSTPAPSLGSPNNFEQTGTVSAYVEVSDNAAIFPKKTRLNFTLNVEPATCEEGIPMPGTKCLDGSFFIGVFDGRKLFTTDASTQTSKTWNNGTENWTLASIPAGTDGEVATPILAALSDAGSPYQAAKYCHDLVAHGRSDWFLPGKLQLRTMLGWEHLVTRDKITRTIDANDSSGTFEYGTIDNNAMYWSSEETGYNIAYSVSTWLSGSARELSWLVKNAGVYIRCTRYED